MESESKTSSSARKWWLLAAALVAFVVVFDLLERLTRTEPGPSVDGSSPVEDAGAARGPAPPEVLRLEDGAIEIRHDFFRRSTIRLEDEEDSDALFDCLTLGIEQTFGDGTAGWSHGDVMRETRRIQDACLGESMNLPLPLRPSRPRD